MLPVYEIKASSEDFRPVINFLDSRNAENDWLLAEEVLMGDRDESEFPKISIHVEHAEGTTWHGYSDGGQGGLYSEEFLRFLGGEVLDDFLLFPAHLNGANYYFLKRLNWRDCFDLVNSQYQFFKSSSEKIRTISAFVFLEENVPRDRLFAITQASTKLLACEELAERIEAGGYRGIECRRLVGV